MPEEIRALLRRIAAEYGIPPAVLPYIERLIWHESKGDPNAHYTGSARYPEDSWGLFQLNRMGGLGTGHAPETLRNPEQNIRIALSHVAPRIIQAYNQTGNPLIAFQAGFGRDWPRTTNLTIQDARAGRLDVAPAPQVPSGPVYWPHPGHEGRVLDVPTPFRPPSGDVERDWAFDVVQGHWYNREDPSIRYYYDSDANAWRPLRTSPAFALEGGSSESLWLPGPEPGTWRVNRSHPLADTVRPGPFGSGMIVQTDQGDLVWRPPLANWPNQPFNLHRPVGSTGYNLFYSQYGGTTRPEGAIGGMLMRSGPVQPVRPVPPAIVPPPLSITYNQEGIPIQVTPVALTSGMNWVPQAPPITVGASPMGFQGAVFAPMGAPLGMSGGGVPSLGLGMRPLMAGGPIYSSTGMATGLNANINPKFIRR